jgi:hypothetical protein
MSAAAQNAPPAWKVFLAQPLNRFDETFEGSS